MFKPLFDTLYSVKKCHIPFFVLLVRYRGGARAGLGLRNRCLDFWDCVTSLWTVQGEIGKQSPKTLLDAFGRYIEGNMTLFDAV